MSNLPVAGNKFWYLVYTKPKEELRAESHLLRQGYDVYLPMIRTRRRTRGQFKAFIEPMFSRYLLIQLESNDNWAPIRSTIGVSSIVYFGAKPAQVPSEVISILKSQENENQVFEMPDQDYQKGDQVRIMDGPMSGLEGAFIVANSSERAAILLDYLGKQTQVDISIHDIDRIRG